MSHEPSFFAELRRRHIFRIAVAYAVTAWLLIQLAAIALPAFGAPHWIIRVVIGLLILFFPVALILAWAFEVTPEGVRRTEAADSTEASHPRNRRRVGQTLNIAIIVILAAAVGVLTWRLTTRSSGTGRQTASTATQTPASSTAIPANSIAVLPFLDLSPRKNQAYFAQGIAEQLLDILAQTTDLRVAARTSAFQFKNKSEDVTIIGKALHVRHVLEGSVLRDGDLVRIAVQLVNTKSGYQEWSHTYQKKMTDIFKVQDTITRAIAAALKIRFSTAGGTSAIAKADPATKPAAYDEYLLGRHLLNQRTGKSLRAALAHFKKAIDIAPDYAPAYAQTAIVYSLLIGGPSTYGNYGFEEAYTLGKPYLERAVALAPDAPDTLAAQGRLDNLIGSYSAATRRYALAVKANPSYMDAVSWLAQGYQFFNRFQEALATFQAGAHRDPLNWVLNDNLMDALLARRQFAQARSIADRFLSIAPSKGHLMLSDIMAAEGKPIASLREALIAMSENPNGNLASENIIRLLAKADLYADASELRSWNDYGILKDLAGDTKAAAAMRKSARKHWHGFILHVAAGVSNLILMRRNEARKKFDLAWQDRKEWTWPNAQLAYVALLRKNGENEKAATVYRNLRKWISERESSAKAAGRIWPDYDWLSAGMKILEGHRDEGLAELRRAVGTPSYFAVVFRPWNTGSLYLQRAPQFDSVRHDPRFQAIVKAVEKQEVDLRARMLPILCNWNYPASGWHPLPDTCKGVHKAISPATTE